MAALTIHRGEWVVVCDCGKALIFENVGGATFPKFKTRDVYEHKALATHELGTDRPGRSHNSVGPGISAVAQTDWHDQAEQEFLAALVKKLDAAVEAREVKRLIVVAPPRALGIIRPLYGHALRAAVQAEIDKDYVKMPVHEIEKHLAT